MILHLGLHPGTVLGSTSPITSTDYRYFKVVSSHLLINQRKVLSILAAELLYINYYFHVYDEFLRKLCEWRSGVLNTHSFSSMLEWLVCR